MYFYCISALADSPTGHGFLFFVVKVRRVETGVQIPYIGVCRKYLDFREHCLGGISRF